MHVLVTSGGTREPVDDVRVLTNRSTGRLGAQLADTLSDHGHQVTLLHGKGAARPDGPAQCVEFETTEELSGLLDRHVPHVHAVFHAAAVADYLPIRESGKLSSDAETMTLHLKRAPKLIDRLRGLAQDAWIVGFKLTAGATEAERVEAAQALRTRAQLNWVLANDVTQLGEEDHQALLVGPEGMRERFDGKAAIATGLAQLLSRDAGPVGSADRGQVLS
ncbi:MAG: phosphopantothenoylcysteine decarboxylase [Planctomycetota bacterium]|nr:phosphopantothenoylcysteine decarboxylase [Planctomycetota bacterium]